MASVQHSIKGSNVFTQLDASNDAKNNDHLWVGSRLSSDKNLLPEKHLAWNIPRKLKLLEIHFNL